MNNCHRADFTNLVSTIHFTFNENKTMKTSLITVQLQLQVDTFNTAIQSVDMMVETICRRPMYSESYLLNYASFVMAVKLSRRARPCFRHTVQLSLLLDFQHRAKLYLGTDDQGLRALAVQYNVLILCYFFVNYFRHFLRLQTAKVPVPKKE